MLLFPSTIRPRGDAPAPPVLFGSLALEFSHQADPILLAGAGLYHRSPVSLVHQIRLFVSRLATKTRIAPRSLLVESREPSRRSTLPLQL